MFFDRSTGRSALSHRTSRSAVAAQQYTDPWPDHSRNTKWSLLAGQFLSFSWRPSRLGGYLADQHSPPGRPDREEIREEEFFQPVKDLRLKPVGDYGLSGDPAVPSVARLATFFEVSHF